MNTASRTALDSLLESTQKFVEDEFDNSCGDLMALYEAHRDYVDSGIDLQSLIDEIESTIAYEDSTFSVDALDDAYETYKASL